MAKPQKTITEKYIKSRLKQGFGNGRGPSWIPWFRTHEINSDGTTHKVWSNKMQRILHLLSGIEYACYIWLEWASDVVEIYEQIPLFPRRIAMECAAEAAIKYPNYRNGCVPKILTTDFLVSRVQAGTAQWVAISVKPSDALGKKGVLEVLELERRYWARFGAEHVIFCENDVADQMWGNLKWLHRDRELNPGLSVDDLVAFLDACRQVSWNRDVLLLDCITEVRSISGHAEAQAYEMFRYAVWTNLIAADLRYHPLRPNKPPVGVTILTTPPAFIEAE